MFQFLFLFQGFSEGKKSLAILTKCSQSHFSSNNNSTAAIQVPLEMIYWGCHTILFSWWKSIVEGECKMNPTTMLLLKVDYKYATDHYGQHHYVSKINPTSPRYSQWFICNWYFDQFLARWPLEDRSSHSTFLTMAMEIFHILLFIVLP